MSKKEIIIQGRVAVALNGLKYRCPTMPRCRGQEREVKGSECLGRLKGWSDIKTGEAYVIISCISSHLSTGEASDWNNHFLSEIENLANIEEGFTCYQRH